MIIFDYNQEINIVLSHELDELEEHIDDVFKFHGKCINSISRKQIKDDIAFYKNYADAGFYLGYYTEFGTTILLGFYNQELGFQRIQWESSKCSNCSSIWRVANPTYLGIYLDYQFDISKLRYPLINCPICGGKFSRPAIWCELLK